MTETITAADLRRALAAHVDTLARVGITYDGRLGIDEGSQTYGRAYRLYRTGQMVPCDYSANGHNGHRASHNPTPLADCPMCHGTGERVTTGHHSPPVGDDYLGMTRREAYETLTSRTRAVSDTADALERSSRGQ